MEPKNTSTTNPRNSSANVFGGAAPIFCVSSLRASIEYYVTALGFKVNWETGGFASVSRDRCCIFLCEQDQGRPGAWTWIGIYDADALAAEYTGTGAMVRQSPTNFPWAYELQVQDPDGNVLRFGSDPKKDQPFGHFLDMHGRGWQMPEGSKIICEDLAGNYAQYAVLRLFDVVDN